MESTTEKDTHLYTHGSPFASHNGVEILEMYEDGAVGRMEVTETHLNGAGIPHGGLYFVLADSVFGAATRYVHENVVTVSSSIEFIASAKVGDVLTATDTLVAASRKMPHHQVEIRNQNDDLLALVHFIGYKKKKHNS